MWNAWNTILDSIKITNVTGMEFDSDRMVNLHFKLRRSKIYLNTVIIHAAQEIDGEIRKIKKA